MATAFELVHYLNIAEPTVIAADTAELEKVETALESPDLKNRPKVFVIADISGPPGDKDITVVCKSLSDVPPLLKIYSFQETSDERILAPLNRSI